MTILVIVLDESIDGKIVDGEMRITNNSPSNINNNSPFHTLLSNVLDILTTVSRVTLRHGYYNVSCDTREELLTVRNKLLMLIRVPLCICHPGTMGILQRNFVEKDAFVVCYMYQYFRFAEIKKGYH